MKARSENIPVRVPSVDLRGITRNSHQLRTSVTLHLGRTIKIDDWLLFGEAKFNTASKEGLADIGAYFSNGVTDPEESSVYAVRFQVVGLTFGHLWNHTSFFHAWISNDPDAFHIPLPGYDPTKMKSAKKCKRCEKAHIILPEGFYVPPFEPTLWEMVKGKHIEIRVGPAFNNDGTL